ncbi:hypothetical protein C2S52_021734 [Perilla frutescens var. hirtella]|nr:hypothetical protein C2S52_021734 [Perilla frutescens var. hirtella]
MKRIKKRLLRPRKSLSEEKKDDATSEHTETNVDVVRTYKRRNQSVTEQKDKDVVVR